VLLLIRFVWFDLFLAKEAAYHIIFNLLCFLECFKQLFMFVLALLVVFLVLNEKEEVLVTVLAPFVDKRFLLPREMVKLNQEGLLFLQRSFPVF
jgi:hypothetical protein